MDWQVLVVDDEAQMRCIVTFALETKGFECTEAGSAEEAWRLLASREFDLVVLDVMLPGASGFDLTERIRSSLSVPIILLTAKDSESARVHGLEAGADDYVSKPFSPKELALRAQAIVRRTSARREEGVVRFGPLEVDVHAGRAVWEGQVLRLSDVEVRLLGVLAASAPRPVEMKQILNQVWQTSSAVGGRQMVKTTVYRLRQKLEAAGANPDLIVSVRGSGYQLTQV